MKYAFDVSKEELESLRVRPYLVYRDQVRPVIEKHRAELDAMYAPVMGRPEVDPVLLLGITVLQMMERLPDRQALAACLYDFRWRLALSLPSSWQGFDPSTLVYFRARMGKHNTARLALDAALEAMRASGYLKARGGVRIDSTHVLSAVASCSRLACVRETVRLALEFLCAWGGPSSWEPWFSYYEDRNPKELRNASLERLRTAMEQAGRDARDVLDKAQALGAMVTGAEPIILLQRVFNEQFEVVNATLRQRLRTPPGAVHNPHDPEAQWSTKQSLGKTGWVGYKLQVCETAPETIRQKGEPTEAVITAVVTQPATASDHGSLSPVLEDHKEHGQMAPDTVFADAGYISAPALELADADGYELCGPIGAPPHSANRFGSDSFEVDLTNRCALCPSGKTNAQCSFITEAKPARTYYFFAWAASDCQACPLKQQCLSKKSEQPYRTLQVGAQHMAVQARRKLCRTPEYQLRMRRRNGIEGTNSEFKRGYGLRRSRYRGVKKTDIQMQIAAAACNLRRWSARLCWMARKNRKNPC